MLHDERHFPEPDVFNPDRFIINGRLEADVRDPTQIVFGFGRRYVHIGLS